ncbi:MAG: hypothetical protein ACLGPM_08895 [Acidobacteriota bacterium]
MEASRVERMRLNGSGALTFEDARTWLEETGLCLFMPRKQYSSAPSPSFVEAVSGQRNPNPEPKQVALAEELLVRLENSDVAVRLNLLGQPGEQPDFVVAAWVLPYVYALRGDRDWRRTPQLTGSRQVSPLAIQTYKLLETGELSIPQLKHQLGREVSEAAVGRAITELWQQLRIIPVIAAPGQTAKWQLLRNRYQKAIAEGASTSQVTAISVLASIYLQAVIAGSMEDVEAFLAPLTSRSKVREVIRGLVATRQVHSMSMGHLQHFYVAGTLPEFTPPPMVYGNIGLLGSSYLYHDHEHDDAPVDSHPAAEAVASVAEAEETAAAVQSEEQHTAPSREAAPVAKSPASRPHFSRSAVHARDRKPAQTSSNGRVARHAATDSRGPRWASKTSKNGKPAGAHSNGTSAHRGHASASSSSSRSASASNAHSSHKAGVAQSRAKHVAGKPAPKSAGAHASRSRAVPAGAKSGGSKHFGLSSSRSGTKKRG